MITPSAHSADADTRQLKRTLALSLVLCVIEAERKKFETETVGVTRLTVILDARASLEKIFAAKREYDKAEGK